MEMTLLIALTIWLGYLTYFSIKTRDKLVEMDQRRFIKEMFTPEVLEVPEDREIVSVKRKTMADVKKERELGRKPQLEKDLEDFNFKHFTRGENQE